MTKPFVFAVPPFAPYSNGIRSMYKICDSIIKAGREAYVVHIDGNVNSCQTVLYGKDEYLSDVYYTPLLPKDSELAHTKDYIAFYPELVQGNPLGVDRVVRYFGNKEGGINRVKIDIGPLDYTVAHSEVVKSDADYILFNAEINPVFNDVGTAPIGKRNMNASYIGKGYLFGITRDIPNAFRIGREWPKGQDQLAMLLRNTNIFYTWDSWTSTNVEAIMCGAVPYIMKYDPWTPEDLDNTELGYIPRLDKDCNALDVKSFVEQRAALVSRIKELDNSWSERVKCFVSDVDAHFEFMLTDKQGVA